MNTEKERRSNGYKSAYAKETSYHHSKKAKSIMTVIAVLIIALSGYFILQIHQQPNLDTVAIQPIQSQTESSVQINAALQENAAQANSVSDSVNVPIIESEPNYSNLSNSLIANDPEIPVSSIQREVNIVKAVKLVRIGNSGIYSLPEGYNFDKLQAVLLNGDPVPRSRYQVIPANHDEIDIFDSKLGDQREIVIAGLGE